MPDILQLALMTRCKKLWRNGRKRFARSEGNSGSKPRSSDACSPALQSRRVILVIFVILKRKRELVCFFFVVILQEQLAVTLS
jgi:hypothetical protein